MKVNISYKNSLTFEQFKEQYVPLFFSSSPSKLEKDMREAWEKAENNIHDSDEGKKPFTTNTSSEEPII